MVTTEWRPEEDCFPRDVRRETVDIGRKNPCSTEDKKLRVKAKILDKFSLLILIVVTTVVVILFRVETKSSLKEQGDKGLLPDTKT